MAVDENKEEEEGWKARGVTKKAALHPGMGGKVKRLKNLMILRPYRISGGVFV